uniref:Uncharacterized protein n=1 Tax=Cacopsylla melanoneura TaxID=428564 RepID=A0A8D9F0Y2_9HEMI
MSPSRDSPGLEALSPGRELILAVDRTYCIHRRTYCTHPEGFCRSCQGLEALSPGRELILAVDRTYCIHRRTYFIHREVFCRRGAYLRHARGSRPCLRARASPRRRPSIVHSSGRMSPSRDSCSSCPGLEALSPGRELILAVDRTFCIHREGFCRRGADLRRARGSSPCLPADSLSSP